jgi:hypothetical protein
MINSKGWRFYLWLFILGVPTAFVGAAVGVGVGTIGLILVVLILEVAGIGPILVDLPPGRCVGAVAGLGAGLALLVLVRTLTANPGLKATHWIMAAGTLSTAIAFGSVGAYDVEVTHGGGDGDSNVVVRLRLSNVVIREYWSRNLGGVEDECESIIIGATVGAVAGATFAGILASVVGAVTMRRNFGAGPIGSERR